jgi:hypothetical protein
MVLAMIHRQPVSSAASVSDKPLYSPCWLNGRRYLHPFEGHAEPKHSYIPLCTSYGPIVFEDLTTLNVAVEATRAEERSALLKACEMAGEQYRKLREQKSMLPGMIALSENAGKEMIRNRKK